MHDKDLKALVAALRAVYTGTAIRVSDSDRDAVDLSTVVLDYQEGCSAFGPSTMIHLHHESQIPEPIRSDRQLIEEHGGTVIGKPVYCPKGCGSGFRPESMDTAPLCRLCGRKMAEAKELWRNAVKGEMPWSTDADSDKGFATLTIDVLAPYHTLERGEDVFRVAAFHFAHVYVGTITEATRQHTRYGRVHRLRIRGTEEDTAKALEIFTEVGSGKFVLVQGERFRVQGEMSWQRDA